MRNKQTRLSPKQKAFLTHYFTTWNATESARLAGYTAKDLGVSGAGVLNNPSIQQAIKDRIEILGLGADETIWRVGQIARGAMPYFLNDSGEIVLDSEIAKNNYHLLKKVKKTRTIKRTKDSEDIINETVEIETYDALNALALMMRHHNLLSGAEQNSTVNNTLIISTPEQAQAANLDVSQVMLEFDKLKMQWERDAGRLLSPPPKDIDTVEGEIVEQEN